MVGGEQLSDLLIQVAVLLLLALWGGVAGLVYSARGFFRLTTPEWEIPPLVTGRQVVAAFAIYLLCFLLLLPLLFALLTLMLPLTSEQLNPWAQVVGPAILSALLFALWGGMDRIERSRLFSWTVDVMPLRDFGVGALSWLLAFPITTLIGQTLTLLLRLVFGPAESEQVAVRQLHEAYGNHVLVVAQLICIVLIVPVVEELLFRGFMLNWIRERLGRGWAVALSAALFAGFHFSTSQGVVGNIALVVPLFLLGLLLGFLYLRQRSLWAPIGLHMIYNGFGSLFLIGS